MKPGPSPLMRKSPARSGRSRSRNTVPRSPNMTSSDTAVMRQASVPGIAVAMEQGGREAHGGQRAFHVAHAEAVEAAVAARELHDRHGPCRLVARFHRVHVRIEDDMPPAGAGGNLCHDVWRFVVGLDGFGRDAVRGKKRAHDIGHLGGAPRRIDARAATRRPHRSISSSRAASMSRQTAAAKSAHSC